MSLQETFLAALTTGRPEECTVSVNVHGGSRDPTRGSWCTPKWLADTWSGNGSPKSVALAMYERAQASPASAPPKIFPVAQRAVLDQHRARQLEAHAGESPCRRGRCPIIELHADDDPRHSRRPRRLKRRIEP